MNNLRPSDIYYTQDSISPFFDRKSLYSWRRIGETLDDLCENRCSIYDIPTISVTLKNGKWYTADNRRLWIFRHLERLGKCSKVPVYTTHYINPSKFTTFNEGESVSVRGFPGGRWYLRQPFVDFSDRISSGNNIAAVSQMRYESLSSNIYNNNRTYSSVPETGDGSYMFNNNRTYSLVPETGGDNKMYCCLLIFIIMVIFLFFYFFWHR